MQNSDIKFDNNTYFIVPYNYRLSQPKIHDLYNIYFRKYINYREFSLDETIDFIKLNNNSDINIIFYYGNHRTYENIGVLKFLSENNVKVNIYFITIDWWFRNKDKNFKNIFKAKNYKVITFVDNINLLNYFLNENYNSYNNNIICCNTWSCYKSSICKYNNKPINKALVCASFSKSYSERNKIKKLKNIVIHYKSLIEIKQGFNNAIDIGNEFSKELNKYLCCFTSSPYCMNLTELATQHTNIIIIKKLLKWKSMGKLKGKKVKLLERLQKIRIDRKQRRNTHTIVQKVFEILASGTLLLYPLHEAKYIQKIGLYHNINCYLIDFTKDLQKQINYILSNQNLTKINKIRHNGYIHATTNLTSLNKFQEIKQIMIDHKNFI
jgi:hypothetical protein